MQYAFEYVPPAIGRDFFYSTYLKVVLTSMVVLVILQDAFNEPST